jgi:hypothetical protein
LRCQQDFLLQSLYPALTFLATDEPVQHPPPSSTAIVVLTPLIKTLIGSAQEESAGASAPNEVDVKLASVLGKTTRASKITAPAAPSVSLVGQPVRPVPGRDNDLSMFTGIVVRRGPDWYDRTSICFNTYLCIFVLFMCVLVRRVL